MVIKGRNGWTKRRKGGRFDGLKTETGLVASIPPGRKQIRKPEPGIDFRIGGKIGLRLFVSTSAAEMHCHLYN